MYCQPPINIALAQPPFVRSLAIGKTGRLTAVALGAIYGLTVGLAERDALHFVFGAIAVLMMLVNASQAGLPFFGNHPRVSTNGKHVGLIFTPFWAVTAGLNWLGFTYALG